MDGRWMDGRTDDDDVVVLVGSSCSAQVLCVLVTVLQSSLPKMLSQGRLILK